MATETKIELLIKKIIHQEKQVLKFQILSYTYFLIASILITANIWGYGC